MSLSERRRFLAALAAASVTASCGFTPAYAPGGAGEALRNQILARAPKNRREFVFVDRFEERLGRNDNAPYELKYSISVTSKALAITPTESTYRYHLIGTLSYQLVDTATGEVVTKGSLRNFVARSSIGSTVASRASRTDAEKRLMIILADQMVTRLLSTGESRLP